MGNQNSSTTKLDYNQFTSNYDFQRKIRDPRYGDISILKDKDTHEQVALREFVAKSTKDFERDIIYFKERQKISHQNLLKLFGHTSKSEDNLCASFYKIYLIIEFIDGDLEREITLKRNHNQIYTEEQLWYLLECLCQGFQCLQENELSHGDIKPSTILVSKMGVYKIAEQNMLGYSLSGYHQKLSGQFESRTYLSPALMSSLRKAEIKPRHDAHKSDVFSTGMTLLHAATLANCDRLYEWENCYIDKEALEMKMTLVKQRYSERFYNFLSDMLIFDEDARPDFNELQERLSQASNNPVFTHSSFNPQTNTSQVAPLGQDEDEPIPDFSDTLKSGLSQKHKREQSQAFSVEESLQAQPKQQESQMASLKPDFQNDEEPRFSHDDEEEEQILIDNPPQRFSNKIENESKSPQEPLGAQQQGNYEFQVHQDEHALLNQSPTKHNESLISKANDIIIRATIRDSTAAMAQQQHQQHQSPSHQNQEDDAGKRSLSSSKGANTLTYSNNPNNLNIYNNGQNLNSTGSQQQQHPDIAVDMREIENQARKIERGEFVHNGNNTHNIPQQEDQKRAKFMDSQHGSERMFGDGNSTHGVHITSIQQTSPDRKQYARNNQYQQQQPPARDTSPGSIDRQSYAAFQGGAGTPAIDIASHQQVVSAVIQNIDMTSPSKTMELNSTTKGKSEVQELYLPENTQNHHQQQHQHHHQYQDSKSPASNIQEVERSSVIDKYQPGNTNFSSPTKNIGPILATNNTIEGGTSTTNEQSQNMNLYNHGAASVHQQKPGSVGSPLINLYKVQVEEDPDKALKNSTNKQQAINNKQYRQYMQTLESPSKQQRPSYSQARDLSSGKNSPARSNNSRSASPKRSGSPSSIKQKKFSSPTSLKNNAAATASANDRIVPQQNINNENKNPVHMVKDTRASPQISNNDLYPIHIDTRIENGNTIISKSSPSKKTLPIQDFDPHATSSKLSVTTTSVINHVPSGASEEPNQYSQQQQPQQVYHFINNRQDGGYEIQTTMATSADIHSNPKANQTTADKEAQALSSITNKIEAPPSTTTNRMITSDYIQQQPQNPIEEHTKKTANYPVDERAFISKGGDNEDSQLLNYHPDPNLSKEVAKIISDYKKNQSGSPSKTHSLQTTLQSALNQNKAMMNEIPHNGNALEQAFKYNDSKTNKVESNATPTRSERRQSPSRVVTINPVVEVSTIPTQHTDSSEPNPKSTSSTTYSQPPIAPTTHNNNIPQRSTSPVREVPIRQSIDSGVGNRSSYQRGSSQHSIITPNVQTNNSIQPVPIQPQNSTTSPNRNYDSRGIPSQTNSNVQEQMKSTSHVTYNYTNSVGHGMASAQTVNSAADPKSDFERTRQSMPNTSPLGYRASLGGPIPMRDSSKQYVYEPSNEVSKILQEIKTGTGAYASNVSEIDQTKSPSPIRRPLQKEEHQHVQEFTPNSKKDPALDNTHISNRSAASNSFSRNLDSSPKSIYSNSNNNLKSSQQSSYKHQDTILQRQQQHHTPERNIQKQPYHDYNQVSPNNRHQNYKMDANASRISPEDYNQIEKRAASPQRSALAENAQENSRVNTSTNYNLYNNNQSGAKNDPISPHSKTIDISNISASPYGAVGNSRSIYDRSFTNEMSQYPQNRLSSTQNVSPGGLNASNRKTHDLGSQQQQSSYDMSKLSKSELDISKSVKNERVTESKQGNTNQFDAERSRFSDLDISKSKQSIVSHNASRQGYQGTEDSQISDYEYVSETYADGSIYEGQKKKGLRHGKGKFYYSDGGMYNGDWYAGSMEGKGILYYAGGAKAYEGQWKDDKFHGMGIVHNESPLKLLVPFDYTNFDNVGEHWVRYEGDFYNDNKEGKGVLIFTNGDRYDGQFRDDMVHGVGTFTSVQGIVVNGEWWQNRLVRAFDNNE